jgi:nucleoside-diphosphate-sugar epimerase
LFKAACDLQLKKVVWASSATVLGLPFKTADPAYAPIDEKIDVLPESSYALSKVLGEEMARQFHRRYNIPFLGLRFR